MFLREAQPLSPGVTAAFYPRLLVREFSCEVQIVCPALCAAPGSPAPQGSRQEGVPGPQLCATNHTAQISPGKVRHLSHPARSGLKTPTNAPWG